MFRGLILAAVVLMMPYADTFQSVGVLRIRVVVADSTGRPTPMPRYRLQITDNPASAAPRRIITSPEGTVDVRLPPGNYTVESERPLMFEGKAYQWTITVDIVSGKDVVLDLTGDNAEAVSPPAAAPSDPEPSGLLAEWQDSLVAIWTATARGSGFVVNANGLIAADQHVIGDATSVEVQLSPGVKVAGTVLASDVMRGVALVRIHPSIAAAVKVLPPDCEKPAEALTVGQEVTALEAPLGRLRTSSTGAIESVLANALDTDLDTREGGSGGPAFAPSGRLIGLTVLIPERDGRPADRIRIVRTNRLCELLGSTAATIAKTPPPTPARLPVEPLLPFPPVAEAASVGRTIGPNLNRAASSDFDLVFITPVQLMAPEGQPDIDDRLLTEFSNWSEYVETTPPVLLIRVTPKLTEGFWTKVARGAAMTQGVSIPPIKRLKPDFASLRAFCGEAEVVPVHPFRLEHRLTDTDTLVEGLYAFDPGALNPGCAGVTLRIFSVKDPRKADVLIVDAKVIQKVWQDFAPYRVAR